MNVDRATLAAQLEAIVGRTFVAREGRDLAASAVDGLEPGLLVRPGSQDEVAAVVAACAQAGAAVIPWGGGTSMAMGNPPARADVVLRLERLDRIVEWDPANLCVSVEAGLRLLDLQRRIGQDRTVLPLDPPGGERVTVGGLVAADLSGPSRLAYGTVRDWVLGLRVVLPDGQRIHCGGRVIKNVSGYDMNKLFIRSLGSLGILTEVTFKVLPMPAQRASVAGLFPTAGQAWAVVQRVQASHLLPEALDFLNPEAAAPLLPGIGLAASGCLLAMALAGSRETVDRQVRDLHAMVQEGGGTAVDLHGEASVRAWDQVRAALDGPCDARHILCRIAVPIGRTPELVAAAEAMARSTGLQVQVAAHAGSGVLRARYQQGPQPLDWTQVGLAVEDLRRKALGLEGSLVLLESPLDLKRMVEAWGPPGTSLPLMRRLKAAFDPLGVCNPGRHLGGI